MPVGDEVLALPDLVATAQLSSDAGGGILMSGISAEVEAEAGGAQRQRAEQTTNEGPGSESTGAYARPAGDLLQPVPPPLLQHPVPPAPAPTVARQRRSPRPGPSGTARDPEGGGRRTAPGAGGGPSASGGSAGSAPPGYRPGRRGSWWAVFPPALWGLIEGSRFIPGRHLSHLRPFPFFFLADCSLFFSPFFSISPKQNSVLSSTTLWTGMPATSSGRTALSCPSTTWSTPRSWSSQLGSRP